MNKNTYCKIFILADFGYSAGDTLDNGTVLQPDDPLVVNPILYPPTVDESGNPSPDPGYRKGTGLESILPTRDDIVEAFLDNKIYLRTSTESLNVCSIIKTHRNADGIIMKRTEKRKSIKKRIMMNQNLISLFLILLDVIKAISLAFYGQRL